MDDEYLGERGDLHMTRDSPFGREGDVRKFDAFRRDFRIFSDGFFDCFDADFYRRSVFARFCSRKVGGEGIERVLETAFVALVVIDVFHFEMGVKTFI